MTWTEIWMPLMRHPEFGRSLAVELFREFEVRPTIDGPLSEISGEELVSIEIEQSKYDEAANSPEIARARLKKDIFSQPKGEKFSLDFIEKSYHILEEFGDENFSNRYFGLVNRFIDRHNLRYDLRRPMTLHPTLSGVFTALLIKLSDISQSDSHLNQLHYEFEESVRDLRKDLSQARIKTCIQKQFNLLEAVARSYPGVTGSTLGEMSGQINSWPHSSLKEALKRLYGFRSDYPGLGHGGNPRGALRDLDGRDMVALCVLLAGFVPYLSDNLDVAAIYGRP